MTMYRPTSNTSIKPTPARPWSDVVATATNPTRLAAIARYDLANRAMWERLDAIAARTCAELHQPISLVTLVLDSAQLIAGSAGLTGWMKSANGTPLEWSFCAHAVTSGQFYIVEDAATDVVQRDNPLFTIDSIASYAGVPIVDSAGEVLGAHCVLSTQAQIFNPNQLATLYDGAAEVLDVLEDFRI